MKHIEKTGISNVTFIWYKHILKLLNVSQSYLLVSWFNKSMQLYIILFFAIALEVLGTMLLPASQNFTKPLPTSILLVSYGASFYFLALVSQKLPLAIIYASWAGLGVFSVAMLSYFFYKQTLNWQTIMEFGHSDMGNNWYACYKGVYKI